ncbi:MAG: isoprenylcysteine carboxylmethyltransferase family protein [Candidatus Eremiobacteraeota bacterium]|nr:isoprenylcysteine carboxylmethyltransferase family protein [Candidatus Eremiobacteraeota bacterium]
MKPGDEAARRRLALGYAIACHGLFAGGVAAMVFSMYHGLSRGPLHLRQPWSWMLDLLLLAQFPLVHSFLLSSGGRGWLNRLAPRGLGATLATTSYVVVASLQLLSLFVLWSPSGQILWQAQGEVRLLLTVFYALSWMLVARAMTDAGLGIQLGWLGWKALYDGQSPRYGGMPRQGLFRYTRQPIYLAFCLTLWTVPTWTPDQLVLALWFSAYCLLGPLLKERRYRQRYGREFEEYSREVPYFVPRPTG